ncbi:MAG: OB-fold domain-containing protein [Pseudomonadota bacterium]
MNDSRHGILALGSYLPHGRLPRTVVQAANAWFAPTRKAGPGERRSFCNWDEDALTMAVEAGRACLNANPNVGPEAELAQRIDQLTLASTSLPFADRSNAGVVREALDLSTAAEVTDTGGSMRAGSTALKAALGTGGRGDHLVLASDCIDAKPASAQELQFGHGAAAMLIGKGQAIASLVGTAGLQQDFVDHYRASGERFEYALEPRWARDAGYRQQVVETAQEALRSAGLEADKVTRLSISAPGGLSQSTAKQLAAQLSIASPDTALERRAGFCGAAQPLLALTEALEAAGKDEVIALVCLGQGVDVLIFKVHRAPDTAGLSSALDSGVDEDNYTRYLALRGLLPLETGIRAERDNRTALSAFWRKHEAITGFKGGLCSACGTLQFPPTKLCVSCAAEDTQTLKRMAEMTGRVRSFTEDWLAYTPKPPLVFGNVGFEDGANVMMEFTDVEAGQLEVGLPVRMRFRIKDTDERRGFRRYFWKPAPMRAC